MANIRPTGLGAAIFCLLFCGSPAFSGEIANSVPPTTPAAPETAQPTMRERAKKCIEGGKSSWSDTAKALIIDPAKFLAESATITHAYLEDCNKHVECKLQLYYEAHGFSASGREAERLKGNLSFAQMDVLSRNAMSRMNSSYEQNLRFQQQIENKKWVEGQSANLKVAADPKQDNHSFWIDLGEKIKEDGNKALHDPELFCYYFAQIIDPTIAFGMAAKIPRLAKFARGVSAVSEAEKAAAAERAAKAAAELQKNIEEKSSALVGKPYDPTGPLGEGSNGIVNSKPLICADKFDCTTYVETVTASALAHSPEETVDLLRKIRYEDGKVSYLKRNHFTELDWIPNNEKAGFYSDITTQVGGAKTQSVDAVIDRGEWLREQNAQTIQRDIPAAQKEKIAAKINEAGDGYKPTAVKLNYISVDSLKNDAALRDRIPSGTVFNVVRDSTNWLVNGVRKPVGTIVSHQGFLIRKNGQLFLRHASSTGKAVVDVPLDEYLESMKKNQSIVGLNILRVNPVSP